ncbi:MULTISPECIES: AlpA family transcriptional regulator [unclassified Ruegeria]|uniref:helix-turn-helix transcriptional regulator n=1 Tax=unclassified Ruegeria TaxID=2625375 RepID=UPI001489BA55|nr:MULTISPECIES: AlpA family phage regulatory protein [unclassified Ruegeria]
MIEKHYRRKEVEDVTGLSGRQIYRLMDRGEFPRPVKMSANIVAWKESDLSSFLESRKAVAA